MVRLASAVMPREDSVVIVIVRRGRVDRNANVGLLFGQTTMQTVLFPCLVVLLCITARASQVFGGGDERNAEDVSSSSGRTRT